MSTKKYLSLEEAAALLNIKTDELIRLREKGEVRGFADRGTWKFKSEDIEELHRRRQPDSNPEVPLMGDDDDDLGAQPTIIAQGRGGSDSDVRLVPDEKMRSKLAGSSAEIPVMGDSDSDVRLTGAAGQEMSSDSDVRLVAPKEMDSDSDVKLADSDSDVRLTDSDSDVRLVPPPSSDSDVQLVDRGRKIASSDSDVTVLPRSGSSRKESASFDESSVIGSDSVLEDETRLGAPLDSGIRLGSGSGILSGDSGISLSGPADSGILLERGAESGISLRGDATLAEEGDDDITVEEDSGITMESDSGIRLAGDSGIRLDIDSGIQLEAGDSGIRLSGESGAGRRKGKPKDELESSIPMLMPDEGARTDVEVPMLADDDMETVSLPGKPKQKGKGDTSVILFDEDEDLSVSTPESDLSAVDEDLEISDDILGDEEDLEELEVFDSDDSVFDESFVEGGSAASIPAFSGKIQVAPEVEWGSGTLALVFASTITLIMGAMLSVDLLRTVWGHADPAVYPGELIGLFGSMFK